MAKHSPKEQALGAPHTHAAGPGLSMWGLLVLGAPKAPRKQLRQRPQSEYQQDLTQGGKSGSTEPGSTLSPSPRLS